MSRVLRRHFGWVLAVICTVALLPVTSASAATGNITGTVIDTSGEVRAAVIITVYEFDPVAAAWTPILTDTSDEGTTTTREDGTYSLAVDEGTYRIGFQSHQHVEEFAYDAPDVESADDVVVDDGETEVVDVEIGYGGEIQGVVTDDQGEAIFELDVDVYQRVDGAWRFRTDVETGTTGAYRVTKLETGTYRLKAGGQSENGRFVDEFFEDSATIEEADDVDVTVDQATEGVDFQLTEQGQVSGAVQNATGEPLPGISVHLFELVEGEWQEVRAEPTRPDGTYALHAPSTGTYRVGFSDDVYQDEFFDDSSTVEDADDLQIVEGATTPGVDATLALRPGSEPEDPEPPEDPDVPEEPGTPEEPESFQAKLVRFVNDVVQNLGSLLRR